jgi:hypothetical protein
MIPAAMQGNNVTISNEAKRGFMSCSLPETVARLGRDNKT